MTRTQVLIIHRFVVNMRAYIVYKYRTGYRTGYPTAVLSSGPAVCSLIERNIFNR